MKRKIKVTIIVLLSILAVILLIKIYFEYSGVRFERSVSDVGLTLPSAPVEHKTLAYDGYDIHYFVSGNRDGELVILLNPAFSDHRAFNSQIDAFSERYRVAAVDLIGHGLSQARKSKDKIDSSPAHIARIMEEEGYERAHLVGVSMGSLAAQYFAVKNPERVSSLTALGGYDINRKNDRVAKAQNASNLGMIASALFSMKAFRAKAAPQTAHTLKGQAEFYNSTSYYTRKSFMAMQGFENIIQNRDFNPAFPVMVLCGEYDIPLALEMSNELHRAIEGSEFHILPGAGHCANLDTPERFNELLMNFIEK